MSKDKNLEQRMKFVDFWANYVKTHNDKEWSRLQNSVINQIPDMTAEQFLAMKEEPLPKKRLGCRIANRLINTNGTKYTDTYDKRREKDVEIERKSGEAWRIRRGGKKYTKAFIKES